MIIQLNPCIPVITPFGKALAHLIIDDGIEHDLKWVCFQDDTGECWTWKNLSIRGQKNITEGRENISPFYNPKEVGFKTKSLHDSNLENKIKYKTTDQTNSDFNVGDRVKIICEWQDEYFFDGETGIVEEIKKSNDLSIKVKFDEVRVYEKDKDAGEPWVMVHFWFDPKDLYKIPVYSNEYWEWNSRGVLGRVTLADGKIKVSCVNSLDDHIITPTGNPNKPFTIEEITRSIEE